MEKKMTKKYLKESIKFGERELIVETGKVAKQADGSVVISYGDTMLLVAAVSAQNDERRTGLFPPDGRIPRSRLIRPGEFRETISAAKGARMKKKCSPAA